MQYWIYIAKNRQRQDYKIVEEYFLPGFRIPERIENMITVAWVEKHFPDWCRHCGMDDKSHPISHDGSKFCTVLFHDAVRPDWRLENVWY
jgi:hypothetical protein